MGDFVSQATIDAGAQLVPDALGHDATALAILQKTVFLEPGAVIAVQGSWGRGKTDVLTRIAAIVRDPTKAAVPSGLIVDALWINPWQYGTPDLLTPLVLAMLDRIPEEPRRNDRRVRKLAETLLRAGVNFGLKAAGAAVPVLSLAADPVDKMIAGLFDAAGVKAESDKPDADPVSVMGERFRELAQVLLESKQKRDGARLVVCVDDLDRCLPDRQVALLEAIRFLISAGAPVTFLIALDPTLARQAIVTHYKTDAFDPDRYLDKMFDLRVNLPSLGPKVGDLVRHHMDRVVNAIGHTMKIGDAMESLLGGQARAELERAAVKALVTQDLANPRIVRRIFDRLYLLAVSRAAAKARPLGISGEAEYRQLLSWIGITERFPTIRAAVQVSVGDPRQFTARFTAIHKAYTFDLADASMSGITTRGGSDPDEAIDATVYDRLLAQYRLPSRSAFPELGEIFQHLQFKGLWTERIYEIDAALVAAGL